MEAVSVAGPGPMTICYVTVLSLATVGWGRLAAEKCTMPQGFIIEAV